MFDDCALVLAAHGTAANLHTSEPARRHADFLRGKNLFSEVQECYWVGEPSLGAGLRRVKSKNVFIVPFFMSRGHFVDKVLPQELELKGRVTEKGERRIFYCDPIGLDPNITKVILNRAEECVGKWPLKKEEACLLIAAHGNSKSENSGTVAKDQAAKIKAMRIFGDCCAVFMEEEPYIRDWPKLNRFLNVITVPFFVSEGAHVTRDIPQMLGIIREEKSPHAIEDCRLWYANSVGSDPLISEMILDQVNHLWSVNP